VYLKAITKNTLVTNSYADSAIKIPIAHGEGRYFADKSTLQSLIQNDQIIFKYCDENGDFTAAANPNGSLLNIAGICNADRNVFGMMPHPERAADSELSNQDGKILFESILSKVLS
jgi:phosphoribosylformylglycinamidine synthase